MIIYLRKAILKMRNNPQKIICPNCQNNFDKYELRCPKCHNNNSFRPEYKYVREMDWMPLMRQLLLCAGGYLLLQILSLICSLVTSSILMSKYGLSEDGVAIINELLSGAKINLIINAVCYSGVFIFVIMISLPYLKDILRKYKSFTKISAGFVGFLVMVGFSVVYSTLISPIISETNQNQQVINEIVLSYPWSSLLIFAIVGPIVEEFIYRVGLFNILYRFNKRWLAYLVTSLIFGFIHFSFTGNIIDELLNLPSYIVSGLILCYLYENYSFVGSSIAHVLNNIISLISVLIASRI